MVISNQLWSMMVITRISGLLNIIDHGWLVKTTPVIVIVVVLFSVWTPLGCGGPNLIQFAAQLIKCLTGFITAGFNHNIKINYYSQALLTIILDNYLPCSAHEWVISVSRPPVECAFYLLFVTRSEL